MTTQIKHFEDLLVWKEAHRQVLSIYKSTQSFPNEEKYGLVSQMRRASLSIPTNIAEGTKRHSTADYRHFLNIAQTSNEELKYHLIVSKDLNYITEQQFQTMRSDTNSVGYLLHQLINSLKIN